MDDNIAQFVGITGAPEAAARQVLEMCGDDLMQAIQLWFNDEELQRSLTNPSSAAPPIPTSTRPRANIGHEDASGVIHIDSDDDEDVEMFDPNRVAQSAQEEEDAAMAKRLQEEMYGGGSGGGAGGPADDDVRAPIARVTETLVAPSAAWTPDEDDHAQMLEQFRARQRAAGAARRGGRGNPFAQTIWDTGAQTPDTPEAGSSRGSSTAPTGNTGRAARLAELFRPPFDLMADLSWDEARDEGKAEQKWILVNLQDMTDFNCQALNRDIWKDEAIKSLVRENFVFLQYSKDDPRAQEFIQFYFPNQSHENPNNYPHVSIVDPRTGEQVKTWSGIPFPSPLEFHAQLVEFLDRYSLDPSAKNPVVKAKRQERVVDVDRMTEEEMLEMALKNSMESNGGSTATPDLQDPDELTKSVGDLGQGEEAEATAPAQEASAFSKISSDRPHTEPTDPASTTRIQFRHPNGRIIRRFDVNDPVQRIYEWLKAEPLEGKEGVEFELKTMPGGKDLIEMLDQEIEEAGLKQATVMVEFVE